MIALITFAIAAVVALVTVGALRLHELYPSSPPKPAVALMIVLLACGSTLVVCDSIHVRQGWEAKMWPTVIGTISHLEVVGKRRFMPVVTYEYSVNGQTYEGQSDLKVPYFGGRKTRKEVAYTTVSAYRIGYPVPVYYDPQHPAISSLRPGPSWAQFNRLSFGAVLCSIGLVIFKIWFKARDREAR